MIDGEYLVRMSPELMEKFATRSVDGYLLTWDFGEPDELGFFAPTITSHNDDKLLDLNDPLERSLLAVAVAELIEKAINEGITR